MVIVNELSEVDPDENLINSYYQSLDSPLQSGYYSIDKFNDVFCVKSQALSICKFNIRSYNTNSDLFLCSLQSLRLKIKIIILTETRFALNDGRSMNGYVGCHVGRVGGGGGGVSVYYDEVLGVTKVEHLSYVNEDIEVCTVCIQSGDCKLCIIAVYRPPSGSIDRFSEFMLALLNDPIVLDRETVGSGDFNINLLSYGDQCEATRKFAYNMSTYNFMSLVAKPTRFPSGNQVGQPSLLDHFWYNRFNSVDSGILLIGITDHLPTFLIIHHIEYSVNNSIRVQFRDHSRSNIDLFTDACGKIDWNILTNDVNGDTRIFAETIDKLYRKYFPLKIKYLSQKRLEKPWLTPAILKSIKVKSQYYKKFKLNLITEEVYKRFRNRLTNVIKKAKRYYSYHKFSNCRKDIRSTWKHLHQLLLIKDSKSVVPRLVVDDLEVTDERDLSEYFNEYFSNIAGTLNSSIPPPVSDPLENLSRRNHSNSLFLSPVTCSEVINITLKLKKLVVWPKQYSNKNFQKCNQLFIVAS